MVASMNATKTIDGVDFQFIAEPYAAELRVRCTAPDPRYLPLCQTVETSWLHDPVKLLKSVIDEHGQSFEGSVAFGYHHDYPDELLPGVTIDYLGEELVISEEQFRHFVVEFASFYLQARSLLRKGESADNGLAPLVERARSQG